MKTIRLGFPVFVLLVFSLVLGGCPGKQMMSNDSSMHSEQMGDSSMQSGQMMESGQMMDR